MELDDDLCFAAIRSRDVRFDGRFFTAVKTTRIYCRPVCPARTPKRENVRFFTTAAAAESEGFRPCLRCRPETSAGTPAWQGTSTTVSRALRIIDESTDLDLESLSSRLGMTDRHLRRLFSEHLGASPVAFVQTKRSHLARRLLEETSLPMTEVAFGAGFASLRRFNDAIRKTYRCTPSEIRRGSGEIAPATIELELPYRPPMRIEPLFSFLARRATPGVEKLDGTNWRRAIRSGGGDGEISVSVHDARLAMRVSSGAARDIHQLVARVRRTFDLAADPEEIATHLAQDRRLRPVVKRFRGTRIPMAWEPFEIAVRAIVGQQVSVAAATTIMGRIASAFGDPTADGTFRYFPPPERLAEAELSGLGLTGARAAAINALASAASADPTLLTRSASLDECVTRLSALRGIGLWTAHYVAMRAIGEPDAFPAGDLGLIKAAEAIGIAKKDLDAAAEKWRPWRAYAAMILWESLS